MSASNYYDYTYANGHLFGYTDNSNVTVDNVYETGYIYGYRYVGIIGRSVKSNLSINLVAELTMDGDEYGGLIGYS